MSAPERTQAWLLSSAGRRGSLVRFLSQTPIDGAPARVVATDRSPETSAAAQLADAFHRVPGVRDAAFIPRMLAVAAEENARFVIPTIDPEIEVLAAARGQFAEIGVNVLVSSVDVARLGWDKWKLYQWLVSAGLPTIETHEVRDIPSGALKGPVVAKPRSGSSGIGVVSAASLDQLDLDALDDSYIVQAHAPGFEVTVDFAVGRTGRVLGLVPRRRLEVRGGEVSKGVTVDYPQVIEVARRVAAHLPGAYGVLNVQVFFEPATGEVNVIEINPRFGGGYPLSHLAGADLMTALERDARGEEFAELSWRPGALMLRYDTEVMVHDFDYRSLDD